MYNNVIEYFTDDENINHNVIKKNNSKVSTYLTNYNNIIIYIFFIVLILILCYLIIQKL